MYRMKSNRQAFSRRNVLRGLGAGALLSPLLPLLNASGQEALRPKRLLLFFSPDGTAAIDGGGAPVDWRPQGTETSFDLHAIHAPLAPFQSKIVVPWGLRMSAGGAGEEHAFGMAGLWTGSSLHEPHDGVDFEGGNGNRTGWGSGQSVDQFVASQHGPDSPYQRAADDPDPETPYRTLELGAQSLGPHSMNRMIYAGDKQPVHPESNPQAAFDRLFGPLLDEENDDPEALARKRAIMDQLMLDVDRLRTRVGSDDYVKIEAHLEGLRAIERRIGATGGSEECTIPERPAANTTNRENNATFPTEAQAMMDIAVHSLACDLTRVASVQLSSAFSGIAHEWLGQTQGHHTISHLDGDNRPALQQIDTWYAEQFAYLLGALDSIDEGDGTLLDNTLVVWGREMGQTNHRMFPVNLVLAGGARGALQTGRFLDVGGPDGEHHAKLLVSMCRLMGVDVSSYGNIDPDSGGLAGVA